MGPDSTPARVHSNADLHYPFPFVGINNEFGAGADGEYPVAPQPPHERQWRHPSEIGYAASIQREQAVVDIGRRGRGLVGVSVVAGLMFVSGLLLILIPRSGHHDPADIAALTNADLRVAAVDSQLPSSEAMGIVLLDGQVLVTTAAALGDLDKVEVQLSDRTKTMATLVHIFPNSNIAVLALDRAFDTSAFRKNLLQKTTKRNSERFASGQVVTILVENPRRLLVDQVSGTDVVMLRSIGSTQLDARSIAEGAPVVDQGGRLIGLCTHLESILGFIPISTIEQQLFALTAVDGIFSTSSTP